jgi:hypothetical protein
VSGSGSGEVEVTTRKGRSISLERAEAEFIRVCNEIGDLENRLSAARKRAEKIAHYIEIAREYDAGAQPNPPEVVSSATDATDKLSSVSTNNGEPKVVRLRKPRRRRE